MELTLTYEKFRKQVLSYLNEDDIKDFDDNVELIYYGLNSIQIMNLVSTWNQLGIDVSLVELAKNTTLIEWWNLLKSKQI